MLNFRLRSLFVLTTCFCVFASLNFVPEQYDTVIRAGPDSYDVQAVRYGWPYKYFTRYSGKALPPELQIRVDPDSPKTFSTTIRGNEFINLLICFAISLTVLALFEFAFRRFTPSSSEGV